MMVNLLKLCKRWFFTFWFGFINAVFSFTSKKDVCFVVKHKLMFHYVRPIYERLNKDPRIRCWVCIPRDHNLSNADQRELKQQYQLHYMGYKVARYFLFDLIIYPDHTVEFHKKSTKIRIEHGFFNGKLTNGENYMLGSEGLDRHGVSIYDKIFVSSDFVCDGIKEHFPAFKNQVKAVGNLIVDEIADYCQDKKQIFESKGLDPSRPTIMVTSTWKDISFIQSQGEIFLAQIPQLAKKYNIIISIHPFNLVAKYSDGKDWDSLLNNISEDNYYFVKPGAECFDLLANADVLITDITSLGLYFPAFLRPIIHFDDPSLNNEVLSLNAQLSECAYSIKSAEKINEKIEAAINEFDKTKMLNLAEKISGYRGNAWNRFSEEIYDCLCLERPSNVTNDSDVK